jgi:hypothetical protein
LGGLPEDLFVTQALSTFLASPEAD